MTDLDLERIITFYKPWESAEWALDIRRHDRKVWREEFYLGAQRRLLYSVEEKWNKDKLKLFNLSKIAQLQSEEWPNDDVFGYGNTVRFAVLMTACFICREFPHYTEICKNYFYERHDGSYHIFMEEACGINVD